MKTILLSIILIFTTLHSFGAVDDDVKYSLSGVVSDESGNPLPGATVILETTYLGTSTGIGGTFSFSSVREGSYLLKVSFMGYKTYSEEIEVKDNLIVNITLAQTTIVADEVVVMGTRAGSETPVAYTEMNSDVISSMNSAQDIPYLLSLVPSLVETSESGIGIGYTNFRIRGSDPSRINVTIDGIPLNDAESQQVFWVDLPDLAGSVSDIQIQRGAGTSTNGSGAFGATVNMRLDNPSETPYIELNSMYGSYNTFKGSVKIGTGLLKERFMFDMRVSGLQTNGYIDRSGALHQSLFATGVYKLEKGRIKANILHGKEVSGISWWGIPYDSLSTNRTFNPAGEYIDDDGITRYYSNQVDNFTQTHAHLIFNWQFNKSLYLNSAAYFTRGLGYYEQYRENDELAEYGLPNFMVTGIGFPVFVSHTDLIRRKWIFNYTGGVVFDLNYNIGRLDLTLGGGGSRYLGNHFGRLTWMRVAGYTEKDYQWYLNAGAKDEINIFGKTDYHLSDKITLYGDLQYRFIRYEMAGNDDNLIDLTMLNQYGFFNPKAGIFYKISSNHESYLSVSVANREPTRANFKDAAGDSTAMPTPERMIDFEAGYKYRSSISSASVNLYYMYYNDQLVPTGELSSVGYPIMTNVESSYRTGIEFSGAIRPFRKIELNGNLTLSRSIINDYTEYYLDYITATDEEIYSSKFLGDVHIAYSPDIIASTDLAIYPIKGLDIHIIGKYVGLQYFDNTSNLVRALNPYYFTNLRIDYKLPVKKFESVGLQFIVNNLFNSMYVSNAYGGSYYIDGTEYSWGSYFPQAGINWLARLTVRF
jgi:iron complex outermembrane receptor protein